MHDNGTAQQADDRIRTPGISQAVRGNSDLPARAWGAASTDALRHNPASQAHPILAALADVQRRAV